VGIKVVKFGGSSLASAAQIAKAVAIVVADPDRRYLVASAPGKRDASDTKVTDLLYQAYDRRDGDYAYTLATIKQRYVDIAVELGVSVDLDTPFAEIERRLTDQPERDYFASRGEYLNSLIIAAYLGWTFIDAAEVVRFSDAGQFQPDQTDVLLGNALAQADHAVVPGFYGATASGQIKTFPRGGSDVTGALVARAAMAEVYENWTDVSGLLIADPRVVVDPLPIRRLSYTALRELTYLGASVLHENAIHPVRERGIPINIRNTNHPDDPGSWIQAQAPSTPSGPAIVGVAGKTGYTAVTVHKAQWSGTHGVGQLVFDLFEALNVVVDVALTGVDAWTFVVRTEALDALEQPFAESLSVLRPDKVEFQEDLALLGIISSGAVSRNTASLRLSQALADANIEVFADAYAGDLRIITLPAARHDDAIRAIYDALV